jgi:hypothetical protein
MMLHSLSLSPDCFTNAKVRASHLDDAVRADRSDV